MKRILVDAEKCSGCRFCEMVCSFHNEAKFSPGLSRITVIREDKYGFDYPVICHQCTPCLSVAACPAGAMTMKDGIVDMNGEACTGCGACVEACTFNAVKLDESSKPLVCDLCGGDPVCVERCPTDALAYAESEEAFASPEEIRRMLMRRWGIGD